MAALLRGRARGRLRVGVGRAAAAAAGAGGRAGRRGHHDALHLLRHRRARSGGPGPGRSSSTSSPRPTTSTPPGSKRRSRRGPRRSSRSTSTARRPTWTRSTRSPRGTAWPCSRTPRRRSARPTTGKRTGGLGHAAAFSFYPSKNLGGFGDAGMVTTDDPDLARQMARLRVHGMEPKYHHHEVGFNSRLDALQAAVLRVKLRHLDAWTEARRAVAGRYRALFEEHGLDRPGRPAGRAPGPLPRLQPVRHPRRRPPPATRSAPHLAARRIGTEIYYPIPLHLQPCFASLGHRPGRLPPRRGRRARDPRPADVPRADRRRPASRRRADRPVLRGAGRTAADGERAA